MKKLKLIWIIIFSFTGGLLASFIYQSVNQTVDYIGWAHALHLQRTAASGGNAESQYQVGSFLLKRLGTEVDSKQAAYWFSKAADQEHLKALLQLALMYEEGIGVSKNEYKALLLYKKTLENVCKRLESFCTKKSKTLAL